MSYIVRLGWMPSYYYFRQDSNSKNNLENDGIFGKSDYKFIFQIDQRRYEKNFLSEKSSVVRSQLGLRYK